MITVIIPSIGRDTLLRSLNSLIDQTNPNWKCLVGFDGIVKNSLSYNLIEDPRINYIFFEKKLGKFGERKPDNPKNFHSNGGMVRNKLIEAAETEWICFLDDDDSFKKDYIETFYKIDNNFDAIVFKMIYGNGMILPPEELKYPEPCLIGISYTANLNFVRKNNIKFINAEWEDYFFLKSISNAGGKIYFSPHVTYNVGF